MRWILLFWVLVIVAANKPRLKFDTYKTHKKSNGFDHRPVSKEDLDRDADLSSKIRGFFQKKRTINILQNPNIPTNEKMQIIDETVNHKNTLKSTNIFAGGLMSEWDFDMNHKY